MPHWKLLEQERAQEQALELRQVQMLVKLAAGAVSGAAERLALGCQSRSVSPSWHFAEQFVECGLLLRSSRLRLNRQ